MSDFLKMDIFFTVATVMTVVLGVLVTVLLVYAIRFLRVLNRISEEIEEGAKELRADLQEVRESLKEGGSKLSALFSFFGKTTKRIRKRKKSS